MPLNIYFYYGLLNFISNGYQIIFPVRIFKSFPCDAAGAGMTSACTLCMFREKMGCASSNARP